MKIGGARFWNLSNFDLYDKEISSGGKCGSVSQFTAKQIEILHKNQSLTDFCHTSLRLETGLIFNDVRHKFGLPAEALIHNVASDLLSRGLLQSTATAYVLTNLGVLISNQIFEKFTFLENDL